MNLSISTSRVFSRSLAGWFGKRCLSSNGAQLLINSPEFSWLSDSFGLQATNSGLYNGEWVDTQGETVASIWPHTGTPIANIKQSSVSECSNSIEKCFDAWKIWQDVPAPKRGDIIRQFANKLREKQDNLGKLISLETGKLYRQGISEVQYYIDICDYAVGLSRTLEGSIIPSEVSGQMVIEQWNPMGLVGVITAFNYPMYVYGLSQVIGMVCGNTILWKSAPTAHLSSIVLTNIMSGVLASNNLPTSVCSLVCGGGNIGRKLSEDNRIKIMAFTGSTKVGREVLSTVNNRFGRCILELGGNNSIVIDNTANIDKFMSTFGDGFLLDNGQSCSGTRRLIVHCDVYDQVLERVIHFARNIKIGNPLDDSVMMGPLTTKEGVANYKRAIARSLELGGNIAYGGKTINGPGYYVEPTIVTGLSHNADIVHTETFAPILYVLKCNNIEEGIQWNNEVEQGLTSSLFTQSVDKVFQWMGPKGSDCGVCNINVDTNYMFAHTSFGGNKASGDSRQGGSDNWKQYMRRSTCVIDFTNV